MIANSTLWRSRDGGKLWTSGGGGCGDVMGGAGYAPTVAAVFEDRLKDVQAGRTAFTGLLQEIEAFNKMYAGRLPAIRSER
ncbi:hypothetical protein BH18ACI5_BH18ACI5_05390 [soil metagenome]